VSSADGARLTTTFAKTWIVNLPERTDRRRATEAELRRLGLEARPGGDVEFVAASRPPDAGGFPSVGARGCFESHHALVKRARAMRLPAVLVCEDDVEFAPHLPEVLDDVLDQLDALTWDFAYLGHTLSVRSPDPAARWVRYRRGLDTTHCYALSARVLPALDAFLDALLERPADHPDGGPMHVDGAYADFRSYHPETLTYVAAPSLARQRPTWSDIHPSRVDSSRLPKPVVNVARRVRRELAARSRR